MQISPDTMRLLMELECPAEQKVALMKAMEADWQAYSQPAHLSGTTDERERIRNGSTYAERKRANDRARRATEREELRRLKAEREATATTTATPGEATAAEGDKPATDGDPAPHVGAGKSSLTSSLRSEAYPPERPTVSTPKGSKSQRGERLPEGWRPDADGWTYAVQLLDGEPAAQAQLERFRDYWRAVAGAKGRKLDWPATWRNWCRTASENSSRKAPHERPHHDAKYDARQANLATFERGADLAARLHRGS